MTSHEWGRVGEDGTVFVKTPEGERAVGSYPEGTPEEALKFFTDRFEALAFEVELLEQRVSSGLVAPKEATAAIKKLTPQIAAANAVGDLGSLTGRLEALGPVIEEQRQLRAAEKAQRLAEARGSKEQIVGEAEKLAISKDWRHGAARLRDLLEQWKALPRIDRATDDALWRRFSTARTTYTRRRKAHFAEQNEKRATAQIAKEKLAEQAEELAQSTDWASTASGFRELMRQWKAAGPAPRDIDEELWQRFRAAQDTFFAAKDAQNAAVDAEYAQNAVVKEQILAEAEALDPQSDLPGVKAKLRELGDRWEAAGKVPKDRIRDLEGRMRKVEQSVRDLETDRWRRTDPEKSARADDMITKLESAIAKVEAELAAARATGNTKKVAELEDNLASRNMFLEAARRASSEFSR